MRLFCCAVMAIFLLACGEVNFTESMGSPIFETKHVTINGGAEYTNQDTLSLEFQGGFAVEMLISTHSNCLAGRWEPFTTKKIIPIPAKNQEVAVYVQFRAEKQRDPKQDDPVEKKCYADKIIHDNQAPQISLLSKLNAVLSQSLIELKFKVQETLSGLAKVECALGQHSAYGPCASVASARYTKVLDGKHVVRVRAIDKAGNISDVRSYQRTVDTRAPRVRFSSTPRKRTNKLSNVFEFKATDALSGVQRVECRLGSAEFRPCQSPTRHKVQLSEDGRYRFDVRAVDNAGHISQAASYSWSLDRRAPEVRISSGPEEFTNLSTATLVFEPQTAKGKAVVASGFRCSLLKNDRVFVRKKSCSSPQTYNRLTSGAYEFQVSLVDDLGNESAPQSYTWRVDMEAPSIRSELPRAVFLGDKLHIAFRMHDEGSGIDAASISCEYKQSVLPCSVAGGAIIQMNELGPQNMQVKVADRAGNSTSQLVKWHVEVRTRQVVQDISVAGRDLDVLFVVDNSESMAEEQAELASKIGGFLNTLKDVNYHVGITTTDLNSLREPGTDGRLYPLSGAKDKFFVDPTFSQTEAEQYLAQTFIDIGVRGSLSEDGIGAVMRMLRRREEQRRSDESILHFLRPQAPMSVVMISDANSHPAAQSDHTPQGLHKLIKRLWPNNSKRFVWNSIVATHRDMGQKDCDFESAGRMYESISRRTGGIVGSICAKSYTDILSRMGERVLNMNKSFILDCEPADLINGVEFAVYRLEGNEYVPYKTAYELDYDEVIFEDFLPTGEYQLRFRCYDE